MAPRSKTKKVESDGIPRRSEAKTRAALISMMELVSLESNGPNALVTKRLDRIVDVIENRQDQPLVPSETVEIARMANSLAYVYKSIEKDSDQTWPPPNDDGNLPRGPAEWKHVIRHTVRAVRPNANPAAIRKALLSPAQITKAGGPVMAGSAAAAEIYGVSLGTVRANRERARLPPRRSFVPGRIDTGQQLVTTALLAMGCNVASAKFGALVALALAGALNDAKADERVVLEREVAETIARLPSLHLGRHDQHAFLAKVLEEVGPSNSDDEPASASEPWFDDWLKKEEPKLRIKAGVKIVHRHAGYRDPRPPSVKREAPHQLEKNKKGQRER